MNWSSELLLRSKQSHRKCWRTLEGKLNAAWTSYVPQKTACWSCLTFCMESKGDKTFWVTLPCSVSSFILFPVWKL
jgi:hypothetical protein